MGETLLNISRAWELADTSTSMALVDKLPLLVGSLTGSQKSGKKKPTTMMLYFLPYTSKLSSFVHLNFILITS